MSSLPADIRLFKVKNGNSRTMREVCSKLITKTPERQHQYSLKKSENQRFSDVFKGYRKRRSLACIVSFEQISHIVLVFLFLSKYQLVLEAMGSYLIKVVASPSL